MTETNLQTRDADAEPQLAHAPTHSADGVDLTLIGWMLSLTPAERLQVLQQAVRSLQRLRNDQADY